MNVYLNALSWANERGSSGGAMYMRKALMSLYNYWWQFSIGEALLSLDIEGKELLFECLHHYATFGETDELREAGKSVSKSGYIEKWREEMAASHDAQSELRRERERRAEQQQEGR
jgi:hypothetical protein